MPRYCKRQVPNGGRSPGFHQCGHRALTGSDFCHMHNPDKASEDPTAPAAEAPELAARKSVTLYASLTWASGKGPVVKLPYRSGHGYITHAHAKRTDAWNPEVSVRGVVRRKDSTPGEQHWDTTYGAGGLLGPEYMAQLLEALESQRDA